MLARFAFLLYRILKSIDVTDDGHESRLLNMIGDAVFKNLAMRVPNTLWMRLSFLCLHKHSLEFMLSLDFENDAI